MSQNLSFSDDPMAWLRSRQKQVLIVGGSILVIGVVGGMLWWTQANKEIAANDALEAARNTAEAAGMGQAAGQLQRIIENYSGTDAAEEAILTLAQVRMVNGQDQLAATALEAFVKSGPRAKYVAPANGLLGGANEGLGKWADAAENYMVAYRAVDVDVLKAQYLVSAARCYNLAGNREKALEQLRLVAKDYEKTPLSAEAIVRLAEMTGGAEPRAH